MGDKSVFDKIKGKGEEVVSQISSELVSNPLFMKAVEGAMDAKKKLDKTATTAMSAMNFPTTKDIHKLNKRLDAIESKMDEILEAVQSKRRSRRPGE